MAFVRGLVPCLLFLGGIASAIYGRWQHTVPVMHKEFVDVTVQETQEVWVAIPSMFPPMADPQGPPDGSGPPPEDGQGFMPPPSFFPEPPPMKVKKTVYVDVTKKAPQDVIEHELEPGLVFLVTNGGLTRLESGAIKRTREPTEDGAEPPPSLCPT